MKAIVCTKYGPPDVLQLKEVDKPTPKDNEALVKVHAASLNAADLDHLRGTPMVRMGGLRKPKYKILGSDIAGRVETSEVHLWSAWRGFENQNTRYSDLT